MKQVDTIKIGVYSPFKRAFFGYPKDFKVWNVQHQYTPDFRGEAVTTSLNGNDRANIMGYRDTMTIDLNNSYGGQSQELRALLNLLASNAESTFYPQSDESRLIENISGQQVTISGEAATSNDFQNLYLRNFSEKELVRIASNTGGLNPVVTVDADADISAWSANDNVGVVIPAGMPRLIGASTDDTEGNIGYYNLTDGVYGVSRELTIGNQLIRLDLRGTQRRTNIPNKIVI